MARMLRDVTYMHAVPASGRCSQCGHPFSTSPEAMANPAQATRDFYLAFENHKCAGDVQPSGHPEHEES